MNPPKHNWEYYETIPFAVVWLTGANKWASCVTLANPEAMHKLYDSIISSTKYALNYGLIIRVEDTSS